MEKKYNLIPVGIVTTLCFLLNACGGSVGEGKVGEQEDAKPIAKIEVTGVNQQLDKVTTRSGSDVILSGQNSVGVDDPIMSYSWQQTDTSGYPVTFLERTNNTVAFTAPDLPPDMTTGIDLEFQLTVYDADGESATDNLSVKVLPISDPNRYLVNPKNPESVRIYVAATPESTLIANVPARIHVTPIVYWQNRLGEQQQLSLSEKIYDTVLTSGLVEPILSEKTAFVQVPMPDLDLDTINQTFTSGLRSKRLEIEMLDSVRIELQVSLEVSSGGTIRTYLVNPVTNEIILPEAVALTPVTGEALLDNTSATSITLDVEKLRQALGLESRLSATNYYRCIDPLNQATTFNDWLSQAGFNQPNSGEVVTKYINNYDLGFGRDMHIRQDVNGNVYSYVSNYNNLENTLNNRNAFAIVVMEYSPVPTGFCGDGEFSDQRKTVKFYTFVPDEVKGGYKRALSMNFDGRGEKYLPGACTACHGGSNNVEVLKNSGRIAAKAVELDASFMPWDLDAFLYAHANNADLIDPVFASFAKTHNIFSSTTNKFSREAQESLFKLQNQMVLHTYTADTQSIKRYESAIRMLRGWYSNANEIAVMDALNFGTTENPLTEPELEELQAQIKTLPAGNYNGQYVLSGWKTDSETENLYHDVFNRYCRLCHVQMNQPQIDFDSYAEFINNPLLPEYVFAQGAMPLSRLTMDRFWSHFRGGINAADLLRQELNDKKELNLTEGGMPGLPQARIAKDKNPELEADVFLDFNESLILDGSGSYFSDTFEWKVNSNTVSKTPQLKMSAGEPGLAYVVSLQTQSKEFVSLPELRRIKVNNYSPQFTGTISANVIEGGSVQINLRTSICADAPDSKVCRPYFGDIIENSYPTIELQQDTVNGSVSWVSEVDGTVLFTSTMSSNAGSAEFSFRIVDSFGESSEPINVVVNVSGLAAPQIGGGDICSVVAISSTNEQSFPISFNSNECPDPMLNDNAATGLTLSLQSVSDQSQQGGTVSIANGIIQYTPPKYFVGTDSFNYTVIDNSLTQRTSTGNVVVNVQPTVTFTQLKTLFATSCSFGGCHNPGLNGLGPNWSEFANIIPRLDDTVGSTDGNLNLLSNTLLTEILNTRLFIYACSDDGTHLGGNQLCVDNQQDAAPTLKSQLNTKGQTILQWIEEGATNN